MILQMSQRMLRSVDKRCLWKFMWNFGYKGMRSVQKHKARLKRGVQFPPFLYISVINSCNLRCQGCWVKVDGPSHKIDLATMNRVIADARAHGNSFFGILGGEPTLHPELADIFEQNPGCYFQLFTHGQLITPEMAERFRRCGNVTPLVSIEGSEIVSDERRGRLDVLNKTLEGLRNCVNARLITGVATSVCQSNYDLVNEAWLDRLIDVGVHYCWFHVYRPMGADPHPELALTSEQGLALRKFVVKMRARKAIGIVDAYYDDKGQALCPAATGISHHINPWGEVEPCPIVQFTKESIHDRDSLYDTITNSEYLEDFRRTAAQATRGCVVLERPDLLKEVILRHGAADSTHRDPGSGMREIEALRSLPSQHNPGNEVPEEHWLYRFAKKHWFFGFGAYT
jgi:MoaA/NifB/PqqE/SkfB family radical SAM enzyme